MKWDYDAWGDVTRTRQSHSGPVAVDSPAVWYGYGDVASPVRGAGETNSVFVQTQTVSYPAGAVLEYGYSGAVNSGLGRPSGVAGGGTTYVAYSYLGSSTIVSVSHPAVAGGLTLDYGATGSAGLDRLGRVVDQKWSVAGNAADEFRYGYDAAGNRQFRENTAGRSAGQ
ncbi:MAG: hypothetical protein PHU85_19060, partial [Phycisphaerae bacterium]|nr:hypothetical protein [Phycisphaerae bacterium]